MPNTMIRFLEQRLHSNRQLRILFFDDNNKIKPEATYYLRWLQHFCHIDRPCYKQNPITGTIDPYATHVAAGRQEVWQEHVKRLHLDTDEIQTKLNQLKEDEKWLIQHPKEP